MKTILSYTSTYSNSMNNIEKLELTIFDTTREPNTKLAN